ncbi:hypothetical protein M407DRAFT_30384 [Tulasnella calospora MUT 4182]|uniref:Uncharacterized protein n=1 Tax=Tulasnella calospora MUT 4182 TaxID=1051891 RepID=A0A0C3PXT6_9AGAM|nr:hypothetical protein M407DRAFT_30384 [Tulasnella calospora MUT 4182]
MPAFLSPGVSYVFSTIAPKLVTPPALILILNQLHNNQKLIPFSIPTSFTIPPIPQWLLTPSALIASSVAGSVVIIFGKALWQSVLQRYEMWKLNAVPIPVVKSKWPGGLDVLVGLLGSIENEYAAQYREDLTVEYGYLYCLSILGEDLIVTFNPEDIKRILATDFQTWEKGREAWHGPMNSVLGLNAQKVLFLFQS